MGDTVNLRTVRKQAEREKARAAGAEQAARHGQSKGARVLAAAQDERARRMLDQHKLDDDE
jgi:hypothetical protein